jgi:hypothetical protein
VVYRQSVRLGRQAPRDSTQSNFIFQLNTCGHSPYATSSLTRGCVCSLQFCWSSPAQSFSRPSPAGLMTTFYCPRFETPPNWMSRSPYLYPPGTVNPVISPGTGFHFRRLLRLAVIRRRYSDSPPHGRVIGNRIPTPNNCYIPLTRIAQETSLPLLHVLSLPEKQRVHGAVPLQRLLCCRLFTQILLGNGSTWHNFIIPYSL